MSAANAELLARLKLVADVDEAIGNMGRADNAIDKTGVSATTAAAGLEKLAIAETAVSTGAAKATPALQAQAAAAVTATTAAKGLDAAQTGAAASGSLAAKGVGGVGEAALGAGKGLMIAEVAGTALGMALGGVVAMGIGLVVSVLADMVVGLFDTKKAAEDLQGSLDTAADILERVREQAKTTAEETVKLYDAMGDAADQSDLTSAAYNRQATAASGAAQAIRDMTSAQVAQEITKSAARIKELDKSLSGWNPLADNAPEQAAKAREALLNRAGGNATARAFSAAQGTSEDEAIANLKANRKKLDDRTRSLLDDFNTKSLASESLKAARAAEVAYQEALFKRANDGPSDAPTLVDEITVTAKRNKKGRTDRSGFNAGIAAKDLAADTQAQNDRTKALLAGGAAMDAWMVTEAGRQAVEKVGLADKPKLTAAETALVDTIRSRAEQTERAKIAADRLEKAVGLRRSADADTEALKRRAVAAGEGEIALEQLSVKEAGLQVLQRLGVDSLAQLTGAALDQAKAAMASAEAAERQAIVTEKATRVASQIRDLDKRIASEKGLAAAKIGGIQAEVDYAAAEAVRLELERAGVDLTQEQIDAITTKTKALFAAGAAADEAGLVASAAEELRLSKLTNDQRELEERVLQRIGLIKAQHLDWTKEEVEVRARALALVDQAAADDAKAIGDLKQNLEDAFIESGDIGMAAVGETAERALRKAIWNAFVSKPIDIIVNAVVGSLSGLNSLGMAGGGVAAGGVGGLASMFNASGALSGLSSSSAAAITGLLNKTSMSTWNAAKFGGLAGGAIGGAGTGMLMSGLASAFGLSQNKGNQVGGAIGGAIGTFLPIPGGTFIGSAIGNLLGGLVGGKKSNSAAVLSLDSSGAVSSIGGDKRTDETTAAAQSIAAAVAQVQAALVAGGATLGATVSKIDIGVRDATHLNFSNGTAIDTAVGDVSAAVEAATKAILANAKWATEAQTTYAQQLIAAGASIEEVISKLQIAGSFTASIEDAIAQLTDPVAYERKAALDAIEANYQALKTQAEQLVAAGVLTSDALDKLSKLRDLQVDAAGAKDRASGAALTSSVQDEILALIDPAAASLKSSLDKIEADYQARLTEAQALVKAGVLSADVLTQLGTLKGLQIDKVMQDLADGATTATTAFDEARPRLQAWLDQLNSTGAELNPKEQRAAALAAYQSTLSAARGGDAAALSNLTSYADRLIATDRSATSSAAARLALFNQVTGDVRALVGTTGATAANDNGAIVSNLVQVQTLLAELRNNTDPTKSPLTDAGMLFASSTQPQTDKIVAAVDQMRTEVLAAITAAGGQASGALDAVQTAFEEGLNALSEQFGQVASDQSQMRQDQALVAQSLKLVASR